MPEPQPRQRPRREKIAIGFMILWIVFWTACMFIVLYGLGAALLAGDLTPAAFMLFWLMAATFGLSKGITTLRKLLFEGLGPPAPAGNHGWNDDMEDQSRKGDGDRPKS